MDTHETTVLTQGARARGAMLSSICSAACSRPSGCRESNPATVGGAFGDPGNAGGPLSHVHMSVPRGVRSSGHTLAPTARYGVKNRNSSRRTRQSGVSFSHSRSFTPRHRGGRIDASGRGRCIPKLRSERSVFTSPMASKLAIRRDCRRLMLDHWCRFQGTRVLHLRCDAIGASDKKQSTHHPPGV
jgi:hypothetical protein